MTAMPPSGRIKTRYVGVYVRRGTKERFTIGGKPDKCFDIHYRDGQGRYIWEKVGWRSEGYTVEDAVWLRGERIKTQRHPEIMDGHVKKDIKLDMTVEEAWQIFTKRWSVNLKAAEDVGTSYNIHIHPVFAKRKISTITQYDIEEFKHILLNKKSLLGNKNLEPSTVKRILNDFRRIINKMIEWELVCIMKNPVSSVKVNGYDKKRERFLHEKEVERLLDGAQFYSCNLYYICKIALFTGMRLGEILKLKKEDIDITSKTIYIDGKTGERHAYISTNLLDDMQYLVANATGKRIFLNKDKDISSMLVSLQFRKVIDAMGLNDNVNSNAQRVVFHTLRHTFCSSLAAKGVPLFTIGELVGHKSPDMTKRYAKLLPDVKRTAIEQLAYKG
jgi:integrase